MTDKKAVLIQLYSETANGKWLPARLQSEQKIDRAQGHKKN